MSHAKMTTPMRVPLTFTIGFAILLSSVAALAGSQARGPGNKGDSLSIEPNEPGYIDMLKAKAAALAESELARMAAIELVYRSRVQLFETENPVFLNKIGVYMKLHRNFKGYRLIDIVRSESLMFPIVFEIEYEFDLLATKEHSMNAPNAKKLAKKERDLRVLGNYRFSRLYRCDIAGNVAWGTGQFLPRPDLYALDNLDKQRPPTTANVVNMTPPLSPP